jgi:hypothetical protein
MVRSYRSTWQDDNDTDSQATESDVEEVDMCASELGDIEEMPLEEEEEELHIEDEGEDEEPAYQEVPVWQPLSVKLEKWLRDSDYEAYIPNFQKHGVSNMAMFMMLTENNDQSDELMKKLFGDNSYKWLCIRKALRPDYTLPKVPRAARRPLAIQPKAAVRPPAVVQP